MKFRFHTSSTRKLNIVDPPIVTVIGKAFFHIGNSLKDQSRQLGVRISPGAFFAYLLPLLLVTLIQTGH